MHVLVIGGTGGIGSAVVKALLTHKGVTAVHATYCHSSPIDTKNSHQEKAVQTVALEEKTNPNDPYWYPLDLESESDIEGLASRLDTVDWIINAAGVLQPHDGLEHKTEQSQKSRHRAPEKRLQALSYSWFMQSMAINAASHLLVAKAFEPHLRRSHQPRYLALSAKVGSIQDNRRGGWYSYRCSKAALNMAIKTLSIEWQRTLPKAAIIAYHPGTTDSRLSRPFQNHLAPGQLQTTDTSAHQLINTLLNLTPEQTGLFLSYSGEVLPW
ncbi:SDR family NAD(P)-dependent oxidoreductase [Vibrio sp. SM6]|uniref:SDR family NAD(P)-dependent oxidoreductase n=1 Tax=Vibrio agarilyticus TaxID=2726741 RepID=A0A7X8YFX6_9VIBR|nr:SDR family NAD(P)-dependent oxidoreductase [Vibrio agarilyticus]NLS12099.1 SDR family NAD(P)-dependent oxidoreductase [Vibrio agarilyticus]